MSNNLSDKALELEKALRLIKRTHFVFDDNINLRGAERFILHLISSLNNGNTVMPTDIAKKTEVTMAAITHHLNELEKKGYIVRTQSPDDRRSSLVSLSEHGKQVIKKIAESRQRMIREMVEYLGEDNTDQLIILLGKIGEYLTTLERNKENDA